MHDVVFLFDVDNTLLNNDRVQADLDVHIRVEHGTSVRDRYWEIFETLRNELGYADYLGALERYGWRICTIRGCCAFPTGWSIIRSPIGCILARSMR